MWRHGEGSRLVQYVALRCGEFSYVEVSTAVVLQYECACCLLLVYSEVKHRTVCVFLLLVEIHEGECRYVWRNLELQSVYGTATKILAYLILIFKRELVHVHFGGDVDISRQFASRQVLRNGNGSHHAVVESGVDEGDGEVLRVLRDVHITGVSNVHLECHVELTVLVGVLVLRHVARYGRHLYLRLLLDFGTCRREVVDIYIAADNTDATAVRLLRDVHLYVG